MKEQSGKLLKDQHNTNLVFLVFSLARTSLSNDIVVMTSSFIEFFSRLKITTLSSKMSIFSLFTVWEHIYGCAGNVRGRRVYMVEVKEDQPKAKALFSEFAIAWELVTITCGLAKTQRQVEK